MLYDDNYLNSKKICQKLFYSFLKNKDEDYSIFIKNINEDLNRNFSLNDLNKYIDFIKRNHSVSKSKIMKDILDNSLSTNKKTNIDSKNMHFSPAFNFKGRTVEEDNINNVKKEMDKIIENNISLSDMDKNEKPYTKITNVKRFIKYIDTEKYIKFLQIWYDIKPTSKDELMQFNEVLNYFINNLEKNISTFKSYDPINDEEKIRNFNISNQEYVDECIKNSKNKIYLWKLQRLETLFDRYKKLKSIIESIINNNSIKEFKKLKENDQKCLKNDEEFTYNYYKQLESIYFIYNKNITTINNVNDTRKNEIEEQFNKKLLLENNN